MGPNEYRKRRSRRATTRGQLAWVHRNRQPSARVGSLGDLVRRLDIAGASRNRIGQQVFEAIRHLVDDEFRLHCAFEGVGGGEVSILVSPPEMLYHIRTKWQAVLGAQLRQICPQQTVRRVTFSASDGSDPDQPARHGAAF